jgi:hypothetical protein
MAKVQQKWIDRAGTKYVLDYWDGDNPPYIADVDTFHLMDAAGFPTGANTDVIFKVPADMMIDFSKGFKFSFMYVVSTDNIGQSFRYQLDMVGHQLTNSILTPVGYAPIITDMPVSVNSNILDERVFFTIPPALMASNIQEIECRITREGAAVQDTYVGDIGLKQIVLIING